MITITDKAVEKLKEFADSEGLSLSVRVKILGGGCSGYLTDFSFDEAAIDTDELFEDKGIRIIVDMLSNQYLESTVIDYSEGVFESGFVFINPNETGRCGCGKSVAF
jgi:iron-sulfur cluster assembly protein